MVAEFRIMSIPKEIYLDNNATTRPLPKVREEMMKVLGEGFGNPSSAHATGDRARRYLTKARNNVADLIGGDPSNLIFTGSGTEANNMALMSCLSEFKKSSQIITTSVEHSSILKACDHLFEKGVDIVYLEVDSSGLVNLQQLENAISDKTSLVSIQWVNNETGVIQPIKNISKICRSKDVSFHTDAAQAIGKTEINIETLSIDFLTLTGHKFHGPAGVGVIYGKNIDQIAPLFFGGPQEFCLRPGTENLSGIVGVGEAAKLRNADLLKAIEKIRSLRDLFEAKLFKNVPDIEINGDVESRICNTSNIRFKGLDGLALIARLDQEGIRCSQSSACTNMRPEPSYVLRAMGFSDDEAYSAVRFSFSEENTHEEVEIAINIISELCKKLRQFYA